MFAKITIQIRNNGRSDLDPDFMKKGQFRNWAKMEPESAIFLRHKVYTVGCNIPNKLLNILQILQILIQPRNSNVIIYYFYIKLSYPF